MVWCCRRFYRLYYYTTGQTDVGDSFFFHSRCYQSLDRTLHYSSQLPGYLTMIEDGVHVHVVKRQVPNHHYKATEICRLSVDH